MKRDEINELMVKKGFYKKDNKGDDVPEEYADGPIPPKATKTDEPAAPEPGREDL